jgi:hypothetical protein
MWQMIVPELGNDSPQISILRVDPKTSATQLLIRTPKTMHIPMHWHSANETHTMIQGTASEDQLDYWCNRLVTSTIGSHLFRLLSEGYTPLAARK